MVPFIEVLLGLYAGPGRATGAERDQAAGQGLVEYALILAFIAIMVIVALIFFGDRLTNIYSRIANSIPTT
jgi:pilus assembly protein Flp/PilA